MRDLQHLTDDEILDVACKHCEFSGEGNYHLRKYASGWAIVQVVRECFELAELCRQAEAAPHGVRAHWCPSIGRACEQGCGGECQRLAPGVTRLDGETFSPSDAGEGDR